jgi:hypothetical protein
MREPYRVAVWGPGTMGQGTIREIIRLPETKLVSVFAYSADKHGVDVGLLLGGERVGILATTKFEELVAAKPEVVIHTARDFGDFRSDEEIVRLLEAGINVISVLPYQYPAARGLDVHRRFEQAGIKGNATLHGTGIDPGFLYERLAAVMTGLSNDIQYVRLEEYFNCANLVDHKILELFGFGTPLEELERDSVAATLAHNYLTMGMHYLADMLGIPIKRIERKSYHKVIEQDERIACGFEARAGSVGTVSFEWKGYTEDEKPMFQIQTFWYLTSSLKPSAAKGDDYWIIEIEGIPSCRLGLELKGSIAQNLSITRASPTPAAYLATLVPAIQAIPAVIEAKPGVLVPDMPQFHWRPDMRVGQK